MTFDGGSPLTQQTGDERRRELRLSRRAAVFLQVDSATPGSGGSGTLVMCRLLDVSANGLKVRIDRELSPDALMRMAVQFAGSSAPLHLVAEVRWLAACDGGYWEAGLLLHESLQTDIVQWKRWVADVMVADD